MTEMAKILVVEDEPSLLSLLDLSLKQAGHEVVLTSESAHIVELSHSEQPDLVILGAMPENAERMEPCRALSRDKRTRLVPFMILSSRSDELDRIVGFELGASDYVVKPFSIRELLLRVQALLRRSQGSSKEERSILEFGCLRMDAEAHRVWVYRREIELTPLEFRLLHTLYKERERVHSRASLLGQVWGLSAGVTTRTVDTHINRLREKLGAASDYIETVRGIGYRFAVLPPDSAFKDLKQMKKRRTDGS